MKRIVTLALTYVLVLASLPVRAAEQAAGQAAAQAASTQAQTGTVTGRATSNTGRPLSGITIQVRNAAGMIVGSAVTGAGGAYSIAGLSAGAYTLECVQRNAVIGTGRVTLALPSSSQNLTCASDTAGLPILNKKVLAALGAAAVAIGAMAVVATDPDGSPAQ